MVQIVLTREEMLYLMRSKYKLPLAVEGMSGFGIRNVYMYICENEKYVNKLERETFQPNGNPDVRVWNEYYPNVEDNLGNAMNGSMIFGDIERDKYTGYFYYGSQKFFKELKKTLKEKKKMDKEQRQWYIDNCLMIDTDEHWE